MIAMIGVDLCIMGVLESLDYISPTGRLLRWRVNGVLASLPLIPESVSLQTKWRCGVAPFYTRGRNTRAICLDNTFWCPGAIECFQADQLEILRESASSSKVKLQAQVLEIVININFSVNLTGKRC